MKHPDSQPKTYEELVRTHRRRRAAAVVAGLGIPFMAGVLPSKASGAPSSGTSVELAGAASGGSLVTRELQSPQKAILILENKIALVEGRIKEVPNVQVIPGKNNSAAVNKIAEALGCQIYITAMPSPEYPGRYDTLTMLINDKDKKPVLTSISIGSPISKIDSTFKGFGEGIGYMVNQSDFNAAGPVDYTPDQIAVSSSLKVGVPWKTFQVHTGPNFDNTAVQYSTNPKAVTAQFNAFFKMANQIIATNE